MLSLRCGVALGTIVVVTVVLLGMKRKRRRERRLPPADATWRQVGVLSQLTMYPLKSGRYVQLEGACCTLLGLQQLPRAQEDRLSLRDRSFIIQRGDTKEMLTARTYPNFLKIEVESLSGNQVVFKYPKLEDLIIRLKDVESENKDYVRMWREEKVQTLDCGSEAARWITEVVTDGKGEEKEKYRIGFWSDALFRRKQEEHNRARGVDDIDSGAYSDATSYMLMTSSSLKDLADKLNGKEILATQFRPNFVVQTEEAPYKEDEWTWIKIGENAIFKNIKPCTRCVFTTINPETCIRNNNGEPLKTLTSYRQLTDPVKRKLYGDSPVFGAHLGIYQADTVKIGDPVYITD